MTSVVTEKVWCELLERDNYRCINCGGVNGLQPAHYVDRSQGGSSDLENIMLLCNDCHRALHEHKLMVRRVNGRFFFGVPKKNR